MRELPPGKPSLLRPDLKKCPSVLDIRDAIAKLKVRMSVSEVEWWEKMANDKEKRADLWNSLSDEQYLEAGQSFDFFKMKYEEPDPETEEMGKEYRKREEALERLLKKKNNQLEVSNLFIVLTTVMTNLCTAKNVNVGK